MAHSGIKKVVLAYSGGLDTSIIVKVAAGRLPVRGVTFTADIGQGEEVEPARAKAKAAGIRRSTSTTCARSSRVIRVPDVRANAIYEGEYLLGTSIARPLIAKRLIEIANETGADAISHGATGKGNDQVRFELVPMRSSPMSRSSRRGANGTCVAREADEVRGEHGIAVDFAKKGKKSPYSMDANLLHISYEGDILEDPWAEPEKTCGAGPCRRGGAGQPRPTSS